MSLFRAKDVDSDSEIYSDEDAKKNQSVFQEDTPKPNNRRTSVVPFSLRKAKPNKVKPKQKLLSKKQIDLLNSMEPHQIAKNHTFNELEQIVDFLTKLYAQLYKYRDEIKEYKSKEKKTRHSLHIRDNSRSVRRTKHSRKSRRRFTMSRRKVGEKRNSAFNTIVDSNNQSLDAPEATQGQGPKRSSISRVATKLKSSIQRGSARRGSAGMPSKPNFALLVKRIKNVKSNKEDDMSVELLSEFSVFAVENALEKSDRALKAHERFKKKEKHRWKKWEGEQDGLNTRALVELQSILPEDLRLLREAEICERLEGNIHLARRFSRHKVFLLLNMTYDELQSIHPADLKNRYHFGGLDIRELRALYSHTSGIKRPWRVQLRKKLHDQLEKDEKGVLPENEKRHPAYDNKPDFQSKRKPSVVVFMENRGPGLPSSVNNSDNLALEIKQQAGVSPSKRAKKKVSASKRTKQEEDALNIYLVKKGPDKLENAKSSSRATKETSRRRPENNIFSAFEEVNKKRIRSNKNDDETNIEDLGTEEVVDPNLLSYFDDRGQNNVSAEAEEDKVEEDVSKRFDFDEDNYTIHETDNTADVQRKKSELFYKAFEMLNSDEVQDDDEVFLKTLRSLSVFTAGFSDDEFESEDEDDMETSGDIQPNSFYLTTPPAKSATKVDDSSTDESV